MTIHVGVLKNPGSKDLRNSFGGNVVLPVGEKVPKCRNCGEEQILFFQFDVEKRFGVPFKAGSHLVVMMCPKCNDIPSPNCLTGGALPHEFWNTQQNAYFAALYPPGGAVKTKQVRPYLKVFELGFLAADDCTAPNSLHVGGEPSWLQDPVAFTCSCGAPMHFLCQLGEDTPFAAQDDAPEQPDSFSSKDYCLFLGNQVYVFACSRACSERAVWIAVQN